jgi:hypothetical protein
MSQILGEFGLLDFTMARSRVSGVLKLKTTYLFNFPILEGGAVNRGY